MSSKEIVPSSAIPIFSGKDEDFDLWKTRIISYLILCDLYEVVIGEAPSSSSTKSISLTSSNAEEEKSNKQERKAYSILICALGNSTLRLVQKVDPMKANCAANVWRILCSNFESDTEIGKANIRSKLMNCKMSETEKFDLYESRITSLISRLEILGEIIGESEKLAILLNGLPSSYSNLVTVLRVVKGVDYNGICKIIRDHQESMVTKTSGETNSLELGAAAAEFKKLKCFYCQRKGHSRNDCRVLQAYLEKVKTGKLKPVLGESDSDCSSTATREGKSTSKGKEKGLSMREYSCSSSGEESEDAY